MTQHLHASYTGTEKVLGFLGADVCRATICNKIKKVAAAFGFAHGELPAALPEQDRMNVYETGHKDHPFDKPTGRRSQASGAQDMVKCLKDYGQEYFLFLENPQIEPTNNLAEQ